MSLRRIYFGADAVKRPESLAVRNQEQEGDFLGTRNNKDLTSISGKQVQEDLKLGGSHALEHY